MIAYEIATFVADKKLNEFMKSFGLRPEYKWFVKIEIITFQSEEPLDDMHFLNMIKESKKQETFWITAIRYGDMLYKDSSVKVLSDGQDEFFME